MVVSASFYFAGFDFYPNSIAIEFSSEPIPQGLESKLKRHRELNPVLMVVLESLSDRHLTIDGQIQFQLIPSFQALSKCLALHWGSTFKQGANDGQGVARPYRTRQSAKHFYKPHPIFLSVSHIDR
jgi:hypothetical protein